MSVATSRVRRLGAAAPGGGCGVSVATSAETGAALDRELAVATPPWLTEAA